MNQKLLTNMILGGLPIHGRDWVLGACFGYFASKLQNQAYKASPHENTSSKASNQHFNIIKWIN